MTTRTLKKLSGKMCAIPTGTQELRDAKNHGKLRITFEVEFYAMVDLNNLPVPDGIARRLFTTVQHALELANRDFDTRIDDVIARTAVVDTVHRERLLYRCEVADIKE